MKQLANSNFRRRIHILLFFFFLLCTALIGRLFILQIVNHRVYAEAAARTHRRIEELPPERGAIVAQDKNGTYIPIAFNTAYITVIASPKDIKNPDRIATQLAAILNLPEAVIREQLLKKDDPREVIAKGVTREIASTIEAFRLPGISFEEENRRTYPNGILAGHLLGFVSKETDTFTGKYGIERQFNADLSGEKGIIEGAQDTAGFWVALGRRIINPPKNGSDIVLTIDYNIQEKAEAILDSYRTKWGAVSGTMIVLDPKTGKILALAGRPAFNPNTFSKERDFSVFLNPVVESVYEFGSVVKPVTMAAGIQEGVVNSDATYEDKGEIKIGGYTIKNFDERAYGIQTMTQVLEKSLNTGAVYVARLLGREKEREYFAQFGFGVKTGIDLPGEVSGNTEHLVSGKEIDFATAAFGQGITATPLQMALAIGAIANGGMLMKPIIIEKVIDDAGNESRVSPITVRQIISKETADMVTKMLISVVRNGYENRAGVKGYFVAGKTGTAQIPKRGGYSDQVIHTFVGFAPAFNPRFLALLQLNEPKGNRFAANTLTPAFQELATYILNYYEVPPDEK